LILDEAHLLEDVATQYFSVHVSSHRVDDLARDVERELKAARLDAPDVRSELETVRHRSERLFKVLASGQGRRLAPGWMSSRAAEEAQALLLRMERLPTAILALRLRRAGRALRSPRNARSDVTDLRGARGGGDRAAAGPHARAGLRALHVAREHERGGRAHRGRGSLSPPDPGRGAQAGAARG